MIGPFESIETFDVAHYARATKIDIAQLDPIRPLQILYALAAEIRPRAAVQLGDHLGASVALIAALNAGYFEDLHFVSAPQSAILSLARIPRLAHVYSAANPPLIPDADFWLIDGNDRHGLNRALDTHPALIATIPPTTIALPADPSITVARRPDLALILRRDRVSDDVIFFANDLVSTYQTWWKESS